ALHRDDLVDSCLADSPQTPEMPQYRTAPHRPDSLDIVQHRSHSGAPAQLTIVGDGEPMSLVPHAHQQKERGRVLWQNNRVLPIWKKHALFGLGHFDLTTLVQDMLFRQ